MLIDQKTIRRQLRAITLKPMFLFVSALLFVVFLTTSCTAKSGSDSTIVTTFYPGEFVAHEIAGENFEVQNITPVGAEPHDLEFNASKTSNFLDAKLVILLGQGFQPAIEKIAKSRDSHTLVLLDSFKVDQNDPHVWLDPKKMEVITKLIANEIVKIDPKNKTAYEKNATSLITKFQSLDTLYKLSLSNCERKTFITSHDAFGQLAARYGLEQYAIAGTSPESEPTPSRLKEISKIIKSKNIDVIFVEELVSKKVSDTLSIETGARVEVLSPIEGLTKIQVDQGQDYFSLMESNLEKLVDALGCSPDA